MKKDAIPPAAPYLVIPVGILAVSTGSIFIRFAQAYAPSITIAVFRLSIAAVLLAPYTVIRHKKEIHSLTPKDIWFLILSGFCLAIHFATWITSLEFTTVASSVVFVSTTPLWVAAFAPFFLGEKTPKMVIFGMIVALLGGGIVAISDMCSWSHGQFLCFSSQEGLGISRLWGDLLAVMGAISGAAYLMIGRHLRRKISLIPYIFLVYGTAAIFLIIGMIFLVGIPPIYPTYVYGWFLLLAIVPQLLGHSIFNWSLKYLPAGYLSVTLLGEPIGASILAYIFLSEKPTAVKIIGAILILAGIGLASFYQKNPSSDPNL